MKKLGNNKIGCFVCNYNKCDFVLMCVESLLNQSKEDIDIYVVDNASTDGSVEKLRKQFGDSIKLILNKDNLGGSGGFNTGLRKALEQNYEYAVLIDNDVKLDKEAIEILYQYMERHKDVGILGAKILQMSNPSVVQDIGGSITDRLMMHGNYYGQKDENLPDVVESDYISTCTAMARMSAVKEFGLMPEDNFIYWDDVEWSKKCQMAGFRTVAIGDAKVWHNHSITSKPSSFVRYYITRNRMHYFSKYVEKDDIEHLANRLVSEVFSQVFGFYMKGCKELARVIMYAFDDFLGIKRGKCEAYKLIDIPDRKIPFEGLFHGKETVKIIFMDNDSKDPLDIFHVFLFVVGYIQSNNNYNIIHVSLDNSKYYEDEFRKKLGFVIDTDEVNYSLPEFKVVDDTFSCDIAIKMCNHVKDVTENILPVIYVDRYCNCIRNEEEYTLFRSSNALEKMIHDIYDERVTHVIKGISEALK